MVRHVADILTNIVAKRFANQYQIIDLSDDQFGRMRYRPTITKQFEWLPIDMQYCYSLYYDLLPDEDKEEMSRILSLEGMRSYETKYDLQVKIRAVGGLYKKYQNDYYKGNWKYFVDLQTACDFAEKPPISTFKTSVEKWVRGDIHHAILGDEALFLNLFERGVMKFFANAPSNRILKHPEWYYLIQSFAADPSFWARSGASMSKRLDIVLESGKISKADKTKWASALSLTPAEVKSQVTESVNQKVTAFVKLERMKARAIVMGDLEMYNKMTFVGNVLDELLKSHPNTTLYMSPKQVVQLFTDMAEQTKDNFGVFMPVDQDEFDHNVSRQMITIVNKCIVRFLIEKLQDYPTLLGQMVNVMALIETDLQTATVLVGTDTIQYQKGVLSGWRFTALYDTLINAGEFFAFDEWLQTKYGMRAIIDKNVVFQGDDIRMWCSSAAAACSLWMLYKDASFGVNPGKFFIKQDCDEYLRQVGQPGLCCGYPARAIGSIVFASPTALPKLQGEERFNDVASNWLTLLGRFSTIPEQGLSHMITDLMAANKLSRNEVVNILTTPASLGGFGLYHDSLPSKNSMGLIITPSLRQPTYKLRDNRAPMAVGLATITKFTPQEITNMWARSISKRGQTKLVQDFEVKPVQLVLPINGVFITADMFMKTGGIALSATPRSDILPSILQMMQMDDDDARLWMDEKSVVSYNYLMTRTSKHVVKLWTAGKLPIKPPKIIGYSGLKTSTTHKMQAKAWWNWLCCRTSFSLQTVVRVGVMVEIVSCRALMTETQVRCVRVGP